MKGRMFAARRILVAFIGLCLLAGEASAIETANRARRQALRDRFLETLVFVLADDTRIAKLSGDHATDADRAGIRRVLAAMFDDDVVLDALFPLAGAPAAPVKFNEAFVDAVMARAPLVEYQLDDDALDAMETALTASEIRGSCIAWEAQIIPFAIVARAWNPRDAEAIARSWESLNRGTPAPVIRTSDWNVASGKFQEDAALAAGIERWTRNDPGIDIARRCEAAVAMRVAVGRFAKAERVAIYRSWLLGLSVGLALPRRLPPEAQLTALRPASVLRGDERVLRFADIALDLDDDASVASAFAIRPDSPLVPHVRTLVDALSANRTLAPRFADALEPEHPQTLAEALEDSSTAAVELFIYGGNRLDDATLDLLRPVLRKLAAVQTETECTGLVLPTRVLRDATTLSIGEKVVLLDAWTKSADLLNRHIPAPVPSEDAITAAELKAMSLLDEAETARLQSADDQEPCARMRALLRMQLTDLPGDVTLVRQYFDTIRSIAESPHVYAPDEPLTMPRAAWLALVNGNQTIRYEVDEFGRVTKSWAVESDFTPATIVLPDGTVTATASLYGREVAAWLKTRVYKPKFEKGQPVSTVFEIPFTWRIR